MLATVALHAEMKYEYFKDDWNNRSGWIEAAHPRIENLWQYMYRLVLATRPISRDGSRYGSTWIRTVAMGLTTRKTPTIGNGPVLPPKTWHFKFTILAPIKYLSSDRIMTWSVRTLCSFRSSFTSSFLICDPTIIRGVAIENPRISITIGPFFTATQQISVWSQIWMLEVKELITLHNQHTDHVTVRSELKYWIGAKAVGTVNLEPWSGSNPAKCPCFYVLAG